MNRKTEILLEQIRDVIRYIVVVIMSIPMLFFLIMVVLLIYGALKDLIKKML